jgi:hypothetical protein
MLPLGVWNQPFGRAADAGATTTKTIASRRTRRMVVAGLLGRLLHRTCPQVFPESDTSSANSRGINITTTIPLVSA